MSPIDPRLQNLLGGDALAGLRKRLRRHFENTLPGAPAGLLRLGVLNSAEREALALLSGRPPRDSKSMQVDLGQLDAALRNAGITQSLRAALEQIDGPIEHLPSLRAAQQAGWCDVVAACAQPALARWLQAPAALGLLKRLARQDTATARQLLAAAAAVLQRLPAQGLARAQLAADTLGDAHALDKGQATATLVLAAWRHAERAPAGPREDDGWPDDPARPDDPSRPLPDQYSRDLWARAGVLVNELARPALLLNLPLQSGDSALGAAGEPAYLSLRRLLRAPPRWAVAGQTVFVCENPNLVAIAADRLGADGAALVCTDGMPAAAQRTLLSQLALAGARLRYHGDFDWPGIQIANHVLRTWGAQPWRLAAQDYEAAVADTSHHPSHHPSHSPSYTRHGLAGACIAASWDAQLAGTMQRHGLAIAEEAVAAALLIDLRPG